MKRAISIIVILIILIVLSVVEFSFVSTNMNTLKKDIEFVYEHVENQEIDFELITPVVVEMSEHWHKKETAFCMIFNHKDLVHIGDSLNRLNVYCQTNNEEETKVEIRHLKESTDKYQHYMGFSINNVF